jgi:hypothetical protein
MNFKEIKTLYDIIDNDYGIKEAEIVACEIRLGIKLPYVLRQYYLELGHHEELNQSQNNLILPNKLNFNTEHYLIVYVENQGCVLWGIKRSDFKFHDPSVYALHEETWELESRSLTDFLLAMAYLQAIFVFPYNANKVETTTIEVENVRKYWQKIDHPLKIWGIEFYQNSTDELLALLKSEEDINLFVAAKTIDKFEEINTILNMDWDYSSEDDN